MTSKQAAPLVLDAVESKARKISNNLLNFGDEKVTRDAALDNAGNGNVTPIDGTTSKSRAARKPSAPAAH